MIPGLLADSGDGVYRGADGSGYVGRVRQGRGEENLGSSHCQGGWDGNLATALPQFIDVNAHYIGR